MKNPKPSLLVFAHVPPPDHGQSRMVAAMLAALEHQVAFVHVDARLSSGSGDIGSRRSGKSLKLFGYIGRALAARLWKGVPTLYYIPGPVKWSAVVRDWVVLMVLRPAYAQLVFHWHAIGQGEWAHGSDRCRLPGPGWLDLLARRVSALVLRRPSLSVIVGPASGCDARAVGSRQIEVVANGIEDPCPGFEDGFGLQRRQRAAELSGNRMPEIRMLFLSLGTEEKGLLDLVAALSLLVDRSRDEPHFSIVVTFAGGVAVGLESRFESEVRQLLAKSAAGRLRIETLGYLDRAGKARCFAKADLFLAPSRWESFGLTVVEAMAWGVPVVAAASDGARGVLPEDYEWLASPRDIEGMADVIGSACQAMLGGRGYLIGAALRRQFEERFQATQFQSEIRRVLGEVCDTLT